MLKPVHVHIMRRALTDKFSPHALDLMIQANVRQDGLFNQLGHDEYHFDGNAFAASRAYIEQQRALIRPALEAGKVEQAWQAFGRLTHTAQDFYSHSNYVDLWLACQPNGMVPGAGEIDPLDDTLIENPSLRSGKMYYPLGVLSFVPGLKMLIIPRMPRELARLDEPGLREARPYVRVRVPGGGKAHTVRVGRGCEKPYEGTGSPVQRNFLTDCSARKVA